MSDNIENEYYDWLCHLVCDDDRFRRTSYHKLLCELHNREFIWHIKNDENRAEEGVTLRSRFASEIGYSSSKIFVHMSWPCSILEMIVALAVRCEENIMSDPEIGDRTTQWFWGMIRSLGLLSMNSRNFNIGIVDDILDTFLDRRYARTGEGGLFTIPRCTQDLRNAEIWYQLCWYLDTISGY